MRNPFLIFLLISVLWSCREEPEKVPVNPFTLAYAGQYLLRVEGENSRLVSERYVLTPYGQAERHRLERTSVYGEYRLDEIERGSWVAEDGRIDIRIGDGESAREENYQRELRMSRSDSLATDTLWVDAARPGRSLELLIGF